MIRYSQGRHENVAAPDRASATPTGQGPDSAVTSAGTPAAEERSPQSAKQGPPGLLGTGRHMVGFAV